MGILIKPIITEKQTDITENMSNRYGFKVVPRQVRNRLGVP